MLTVTKSFTFAYAHFLPEYPGKCKNIHGHTGVLEVEVDGCEGGFGKGFEGMVLDFSILKSIVQTKIIDEWDHRFLNDSIGVPTAENMVNWALMILNDTPLEGHLVRIRIYETPTSWAEWKRE